MPDKIMPDDFVGDGDAFARIGIVPPVPTKLICSDCQNRVRCNKSPLRRWCAECKKFGCSTYINPTLENGKCSNYVYTTIPDNKL